MPNNILTQKLNDMFFAENEVKMNGSEQKYEIPNDKREAFEAWLEDNELNYIIKENVDSGFWPNFDQSKLNKLFLDEERRKEERWGATKYDIFNELFREFEGNVPPNRPSDEHLFQYASQMFFQDCQRAVSLVMLLARRDYPPALVKAGELLITGDYLPSNLRAAGRYIERAYELDYDGCLSILAYLQGHGYGDTPKNIKLAKKTFKQALASDNPDNYPFLAVNYAVGRVVEKDLKVAEKYFIKSLEKGYLEAALYYYALLENDVFPKQSDDMAGNLTELTDLGYPAALYLTAMFLLHIVEGVEPESEERTKNLIKTANNLITFAIHKNYFRALLFSVKNEELSRYDGTTYHLSYSIDSSDEDDIDDDDYKDNDDI